MGSYCKNNGRLVIVTLPIPKLFWMKSNTEASSMCNLIKNINAKVLPVLVIRKQPSAPVKHLNHSMKSPETVFCLPLRITVKYGSELSNAWLVNFSSTDGTGDLLKPSLVLSHVFKLVEKNLFCAPW